MGNWYEETFDGQVRFGLKVRRTLHSNRSKFQRVELLETEFFGKALVLDGLFMTSEKDEFFYHEMIVHPALCAVRRRARVLVIGGGDGGTVRELMRWPDVEQVVMVEIDGEVVDVCREHLPSIASAFDEPRLELRIEDGIEYVAKVPACSFDVVLLDGSDPVGPAEGLFNESFYADVKRVLKPDGIFGLQSESPVLQTDVFQAVQKTLRVLFDDVKPYIGSVPLYGSAMWSWTLARPVGEVFPLDTEPLHGLEAELRYMNRELCKAAFVLPTFVRKLATGV
ncbi:MAG: polyamine aminopropyltransferase [Myxococcota bacterium]